MEAYRALRPGSEVPRTTENPQPSRDPKRRLLYLEKWLSLAVTSPRVPTLEDHLPLLPRVEDQRHLRETQRGAARALADMLGQEPAPQRRDSRLAVGKDHRSRRRTTRLRRRQEGSRQEASPTGGHRGTGPQSPAVHSAKIPEQDGLKMLLGSARAGVSYLKHLWLDAGYEGRGKRWAEEALGLRVEIVRKPAKPVPEKVAMIWAEEWAKEGKKVDWQRLMPPRGFKVLPRRWVVERTFFSWLDHNRRMSKDYERLCATAEAFIYVAMTRLMVRRLARA